MDPSTRTGNYWIVWEERRGRWRLRGISRAAAGVTILLAFLAASAGVLVALTQAGKPWIGWAWVTWVLAVALVGGRTISALSLGPIRRSAPFRGGSAGFDSPPPDVMPGGDRR